MMSKVLTKVRRVVSRSPHELWTRAVQQAAILDERAQVLLYGAVRPRRESRADRAAAGPSRFPPAGPATDEIVASLRRTAPWHEGDVLARATRIESGQVPLMGFGWVDIGATPDWLREPFSGRTAPRAHWSTIPYLDPSVVGDHKVLWEFNRHQHFVTLGQAWRFSRDARWPTVWARQLGSWLQQNPAGVGMNWCSSLEVAYRAISWCWAERLMGDSGVVDGALRERMLESLDAHGQHVSRHLSTYFSPNTHLTGEALGLVYIGGTFPELARATEWYALGTEVLRSELSRQVLPDGVYFEQATQYHRYTTEIYLHLLLLMGERAARDVEPERRALHRLFDVLLALSRADGTMALIGDDDGGRLVQLDGERPHELRALLAAGAVALERTDLAHAAGMQPVMATWLHGAGAADSLSRLLSTPPQSHGAQAFPDGGLFVMRDTGGSGEGHATIDAGPHGALSFGHSHSDALAIELYAGGGPLFVDSGTATYVGAERDRFRVTRAHNTLELDGASVCAPGTAFRWNSVVHGVAEEWADGEGLTWFAGHHEGYARPDAPLRHRRGVFHPHDGVWVILDKVSGSGLHDGVVRWHCDPDVRAAAAEPLEVGALVPLYRGGAHVASLVVECAPSMIEYEPTTISRQFGHQEATVALCLRARLDAERDAQVVSIVLDWTAIGADTAVELHLGGAAARVFTPAATRGAASVTMALHADGRAVTLFDGTSIEAALAWVDGSAHAPRVAAVGVRQLMVAGSPAVHDLGGDSWIVGRHDGAAWQLSTGDSTSF